MPPVRWTRRSLQAVTREEAERLAEQRSTEGGDAATHQWIAREAGDGEWAVVKVPLPKRQATRPVVESAERPPQPDDVRTPLQRNVPPYGG